MFVLAMLKDDGIYEGETGKKAWEYRVLWATRLSPRSEVSGMFAEFDASWKDVMWKALDDIVGYRRQLQRLGIDCNTSYSWFEAGIYPIDATSENLRRVCTDDLPEDLDDLVSWPEGAPRAFPERFAERARRWVAFVLGLEGEH